MKKKRETGHFCLKHTNSTGHQKIFPQCTLLQKFIFRFLNSDVDCIQSSCKSNEKSFVLILVVGRSLEIDQRLQYMAFFRVCQVFHSGLLYKCCFVSLVIFNLISPFEVAAGGSVHYPPSLYLQLDFVTLCQQYVEALHLQISVCHTSGRPESNFFKFGRYIHSCPYHIFHYKMDQNQNTGHLSSGDNTLFSCQAEFVVACSGVYCVFQFPHNTE